MSDTDLCGENWILDTSKERKKETEKVIYKRKKGLRPYGPSYATIMENFDIWTKGEKSRKRVTWLLNFHALLTAQGHLGTRKRKGEEEFCHNDGENVYL